MQVEGGQESLLEWATFSIELVHIGNESEVVANVSTHALLVRLILCSFQVKNEYLLAATS